MEKEFIPYEQALALKELGFDEPCFGFFVKSDKINMFQECEWEERTNNGFIKDFLNSKYCSTAPTFSQAFRWFREKFGLNSHIHQENRDEYSYCCGQGYSDEIGGYRGFETYEEAELECLKKLIEIVKNKG